MSSQYAHLTIPTVGSILCEQLTVTMEARDLFDNIAWFPALLEASDRAAKGKRARPEVAAFLAGQVFEVLRLEFELEGGTYHSGRYRMIEVFETKHRVVSNAPICRGVHHAVYSVERGFIYNSYDNPQGRAL